MASKSMFLRYMKSGHNYNFAFGRNSKSRKSSRRQTKKIAINKMNKDFMKE